MTVSKLLKELENFDTPSITNVVATYPDNPLCLGLYNPWHENWYTDETIRCMFPALGPRVGYAVTCVYGLADPAFKRLTLEDVIDALDASPKPVILALEQKFPPEIQGKVGLSGGVMTTSFKGGGVRRRGLQRSVAGHGRDPADEGTVPLERRDARPRHHERARDQRPGFGGQHGRLTGRDRAHGRERGRASSLPTSLPRWSPT